MKCDVYQCKDETWKGGLCKKHYQNLYGRELKVREPKEILTPAQSPLGNRKIDKFFLWAWALKNSRAIHHEDKSFTTILDLEDLKEYLGV